MLSLRGREFLGYQSLPASSCGSRSNSQPISKLVCHRGSRASTVEHGSCGGSPCRLSRKGAQFVKNRSGFGQILLCAGGRSQASGLDHWQPHTSGVGHSLARLCIPTVAGVASLSVRLAIRLLLLVGCIVISVAQLDRSLLTIRLEPCWEYVGLLCVSEDQRLTLVMNQSLHHAAHARHEILHTLQPLLELFSLGSHWTFPIALVLGAIDLRSLDTTETIEKTKNDIWKERQWALLLAPNCLGIF